MSFSLTNYITDLRTIVIAAVASEGNVGNNVFAFGAVNDNPDWPYIIIEDEQASDGEYRTHELGLTANEFDFSVHVHTRTRSQGITISDLIANALNNVSGVQGSTNFGVIRLKSIQSFFDEDTKTREQILDFSSYVNS